MVSRLYSLFTTENHSDTTCLYELMVEREGPIANPDESRVGISLFLRA